MGVQLCFCQKLFRWRLLTNHIQGVTDSCTSSTLLFRDRVGVMLSRLTNNSNHLESSPARIIQATCSGIFYGTLEALIFALKMLIGLQLRALFSFSSCARRSLALQSPFQSPASYIAQDFVLSTMASASETPAPWHAAYPEPRNSKRETITREEVLDMMKNGGVAGRDFILVDLRRADHEVRTHLTYPLSSLWTYWVV